MDLFLYQLNISGLTVSATLIAWFFHVLRRTIRRAEMRWWCYGWYANVVALAITSLFWYAQPPVAFHGPIFAIYMAPKMVYVWMLLRGALEFHGSRPRALAPRTVIPAIVALCLVCVFVVTTRDRLGVVSQGVIGICFGAGAIVVARAGGAISIWLVIAFVLRAVLAAVETTAYGINLAGDSVSFEGGFLAPANAVLAARFPLDIAAEWLIAMGMVLAVSARAQRELQVANTQMLAAQADLRRLADRDPLTALSNRRVLPEILRGVQPQGAVLIFFDLDDFKQINDDHGHQAGDECLLRFSAALADCFRPSDAIVRYAGDEFLVVASGLAEGALAERVDAVRARVSKGGLPIRFSHGIGRLAAGGNPEEALREADEAMYRAKARYDRAKARYDRDRK